MVEGEPEIDLWSSDIARFYPHQRTREHVKARTTEDFNKTYGIVHPGEQWASDRNARGSRRSRAHGELGAVFYEAAGWERPHWYESNAGLVEEFGVQDRVRPSGTALVVADHQRRAPGDARAGRHVRPVGLLRLRRRRAGSAGLRPAVHRCAQMDVRTARSSTRPCSTVAAASAPT